MTNSIMEEARQVLPLLSELRRTFHRRPELAYQEFETAAHIEKELDVLDIEHKRIGETGVLGILRGREPGAVTALRADIDALSIQEETGAAYRSETDGVMHACGHDVHTACLLGGARLLRGRAGSFRGEVRLLFQPAEEIGGGAFELIDAGALQGAERVFGLHVAPELPLGTVGIKPGLNNAAVDHFLIRIHGRSSHVSLPHLGADALYAASQLVVAIQGIAARRTSPVEPVVLGVGKLISGTTYNAVAEYAELEGTTRTVSQETRMEMRKRIDETAGHIAAVSGTEAEVTWKGICSALINDSGACAEAESVAASLGLNVTGARPLSLAGDNFSEFLNEIPGCYAYLGTSNPARPDTLAGIHNGHFDIDEEALSIGAALYAASALQALGAPY